MEYFRTLVNVLINRLEEARRCIQVVAGPQQLSNKHLIE